MNNRWSPSGAVRYMGVVPQVSAGASYTRFAAVAKPVQQHASASKPRNATGSPPALTFTVSRLEQVRIRGHSNSGQLAARTDSRRTKMPGMDRRIASLIGASVLLVAIVVIVVVAGGSSDDDGGGAISDDLSTKPVIAASSDLPSELVTNDIVVGEGPAAEAGDTVSMQYVGVVTDTGKEFDASWDRGEPFEFELGSGSVIPGWDEGIPGMQVGGRRELIIPPNLAYGEAGSPPDIPPNATLTFVVDLQEIK